MAAAAAVEVSDINEVILNSIHMLSWKLLAVFHDAIHDFGLSIDRMCSIVKYINHVKDLIKSFENDPTEKDDNFIGGAGEGNKKTYAETNDISTLYTEERNIASIPESESPSPTVPIHSEDGKTTDLTNMYQLYKKLYDKYMFERNWFNNNGGLHISKIDNISEENNKIRVYRLQTYTQFFTNITKLIDLFKFLIVIQVINKHGMTNPPTPFLYNSVHKETVLSAMFDLIFAIGNGEIDHDLNIFKNENEQVVTELCFLLSVMEIIFQTISSRHCLLQLDLLNSSTFNSIVHIFFSCYFYDENTFKTNFGILTTPRDQIAKNVQLMQDERQKRMAEGLEDEDKEDVDTSSVQSQESDATTSIVKRAKKKEVLRAMNIEFDYDTGYTPNIVVEAKAASAAGSNTLLPASADSEEEEEKDPQDLQLELKREFEGEGGVEEFAMGGGGKQRKRYDLLRPFILKGGAGAKFEKWRKSMRENADNHTTLGNMLTEWKNLKKDFDSANKNPQGTWADGLYDRFKSFFDSILKIDIVKTNFPIFFNKMKKDCEYLKSQADNPRDGRITNTRTNPKATFVTKISDYMNELNSEVDALKAEMDNYEKREITKDQRKSTLIDSVDTAVTNQISKLMAKKGLEYAKATLETMIRDPNETSYQDEVNHISICLVYVEEILARREENTTKLDLPTKLFELPIPYQILMNHVYFLGTAYLQHKNCLPDIDSKLINYWRGLLSSSSVSLPDGVSIMSQDILKNLPASSSIIPRSNIGDLRVINNGIPSSLKDIFSNHVVCPSSSVCDAMGSFGSCAGIKRKNEFISMNIRITNTNRSDYYDVYSKIDKKLLQVVSNSFILKFPSEEPMVIECRLSNINLDIKPEMLSANNVFKLTLGAIEGIMKEQAGPMQVNELWGLLYIPLNFKKIITPTCQKATGDINQELNSIVKNGGYNDLSQQNTINNINDKITVGLAGDRPSGVRMILLALYATNRSGLLSSFAVGYGHVSDSFVVFQGIPPPKKEKKEKKGGRITKKKILKSKRNNTRKNKSHHYRVVSKRRKYYNKTKNTKTKIL